MTRRSNADQAFAEFECWDVKDTGTWQEQDQDEWSMRVYFEDEHPATFVVRFHPNQDTVREVYFAG